MNADNNIISVDAVSDMETELLNVGPEADASDNNEENIPQLQICETRLDRTQHTAKENLKLKAKNEALRQLLKAVSSTTPLQFCIRNFTFVKL